MPDLESQLERRLERLKDWYSKYGIDKAVWCEATGYSEAEYDAWHSDTGEPPSVDQVVQVFLSLDINPVFIWTGLGPEKVSEVITLTQGMR